MYSFLKTVAEGSVADMFFLVFFRLVQTLAHLGAHFIGDGIAALDQVSDDAQTMFASAKVAMEDDSAVEFALK